MRRKNLRYTRKLAEYVLTKMEEGKNLVEICALYNKNLKESEPTLKTNSIHRWKRDHPEFKDLYNTAYESRIQYLCEYAGWLVSQPPASTGDHKRDNLLLTQRKNEIDWYKFQIARHYGSHSKQKVSVTHENAPTIVLTDYSIPAIVKNEDTEDDEVH